MSRQQTSDGVDSERKVHLFVIETHLVKIFLVIRENYEIIDGSVIINYRLTGIIIANALNRAVQWEQFRRKGRECKWSSNYFRYWIFVDDIWNEFFKHFYDVRKSIEFYLNLAMINITIVGVFSQSFLLFQNVICIILFGIRCRWWH